MTSFDFEAPTCERAGIRRAASVRAVAVRAVPVRAVPTRAVRVRAATVRTATVRAGTAVAALVLGACASSPRATELPPVRVPEPASAAMQAQASTFAQAQGAFIVRLGADTIAVERYRRSGRTLEGDVLLRSPRVRTVRYLATLGADGRVERFEASTLQPGGQPSRPTVLELTGDSVIFRIPSGDSTRVVRRQAGALAVPWLGNSWALAEQAIAYALSSGRDSATILQAGLGGGPPQATFVRRAGAGVVELGYFGDPVIVRLDAAGRVSSADGARTTNKATVQRVDSVDYMALARAFASREAAGQGLGVLSTRDTARATIGGAALSVDYGRPSKRGRQIWGGVVPWDRVWRTGANEATHFTTSRDVVIGSTTIPAGTYTLWTIPTSSGATLIVNRRTGEWGTNYDQASDLARIQVHMESLPSPVEQFTITIEPRGASGGVMRLMWDERAIVVPIQIRE